MAIELFGSVAVASLRIMSKKDRSNRSTEYAVTCFEGVMCDVCEEYYDEDDLIHFIRRNRVPDDILLCEFGWSEVCAVRGRYGFKVGLITEPQWEEVCRSRGHLM